MDWPSLKGALGRRLQHFGAATSGNVAIIFAVTLPILLGFAALAAEYGHGLVVQGRNQRIADMAAYSGALVYSATSSQAAMLAAGQRVAKVNGLNPASITMRLGPSPRSSSSQAVEARVDVQQPLYLAPILGVPATLGIVTTAYAQVGGASAACILALDGAKSGVTLSGGTSVTASNCAVSSNNTITVPCGTKITAKAVSYNSAAAPSQPCSGITASAITKVATADPFAGNAGVASANARIATVAAMTGPAGPGVPTVPAGTSIEFGWDQATTKSRATTIGCTASFASNTWTLTCPNGGTYNFGTLTLGGGINLNFNTTGSATTTYNFSGSITTSATVAFGPGKYNVVGNITTNGTTSFGAGTYKLGGSLIAGGGATTTFGAGTFEIAKGIVTGGGTTTSFGAGSFWIGANTTTCNGTGLFSICNTSTLTILGPSVFKLAAGVSNTGGSTLYLGKDSTQNSFQIGAANTGDALSLGGGSKTYLSDALGTGNVFQLAGHLSAPSGGGSCLVISAAPQHDIKGNFNVAGAVIMGAGVYTIDGYYALGANGGGGSPCNGYTISVQAIGVTIVISGKATPGSGSCLNQAFCVAAGYSNITLTAPDSGDTAKFAVIGPISAANTKGATFAEGGTNGKISGVFYFPNGAISMTGGAGVSGGTSCLQLIGSSVTLAGGTTLASECAMGATGGGGKVTLVQ